MFFTILTTAGRNYLRMFEDCIEESWLSIRNRIRGKSSNTRFITKEWARPHLALLTHFLALKTVFFCTKLGKLLSDAYLTVLCCINQRHIELINVQLIQGCQDGKDTSTVSFGIDSDTFLTSILKDYVLDFYFIHPKIHNTENNAPIYKNSFRKFGNCDRL